MTETGCVCAGPGFCERHGIKKNAHFHMLCQTKQSYFQAWEGGYGPGQHGKPPVKPCGHVTRQATATMPPMSTQLWNLTKSLVSFVSDGCKLVTTEQYEKRLQVCDACEFRENRRCVKCGCAIDWKARGRAFQCKEGKWEEL